MLTKFIPQISLKKVFIRGMFVEQNIADAVGATLCRPARRNCVMRNALDVCSQIFFSHADFTDFAEAHLLRVLALRGV
jgi:hypothetical protein